MKNNIHPESSLNIRRGKSKDAVRIVELSRQLGYLVGLEIVEDSLARLRRDRNHCVFVAEKAGFVVGWIQIGIRLLLMAGMEAEIEGLVVDEEYRRQGIGVALVRQAEEWATDRKMGAIRVRSNIIREGAHEFYKNDGYQRIKTQEIYRKDLK
ncbi:MAG: GNAT family N-acetyltransferase [Candidatus Eisenbacteria bacterium]|uniref:GNAT family N-acetyltransferase n=1 Tax=Eiseniibacteriota bacterium TaxID=2212470 RepID=A0A948S060_UNCEI|nr:GNAT family N-acetyltransferase [Candidatus Eisenbacteria bacterium]MBU1950846.1 GNAT family N-acetyltransferase [Candidatus Eisenbacteria bacterium]MBU2692412.1 GNAT family N-acetyltransferase [Candidatus Eisenbacteria bacterium]